MAKNTTPEEFDETITNEEGTEKPTSEQILMNENEILQGLLALGNGMNDEENYETIEIRRRGVLHLSFRIRPVSEEENQTCFNKATKYAARKPNQPKRAIETNSAKYRSYLIYTATVDEDRKKIWDNRTAQQQLNVVQAVDLIDKVLLAGEKDRIIDKINDISGFGEEIDEAEETAKN